MKQLMFKQRAVQGMYDLSYIWRQEFRTTLRDQNMLIFFVLAPLVYLLTYSFIYTNEAARGMPIVVVDNSHSSLSQEYLRKVDTSPETSIVAYCVGMEEAKLTLKDHKAYGIIYIPARFSDNIVQGRQTQVSIFCDMSRLLYYRALLTASTNISPAMNAVIKMERTGSTTTRQGEITAYPIEYEDVAIFNPINGLAAFLIPVILILIIQQTLLLGISLSARTAREHSQFKDLVPINRHCNDVLRVVMGKRLSYFVIYSLVAVYILCVVPRLFSFNQTAIPGVLTLFILPYLTVCILFVTAVSIAIRNQETCMLLFIFISVPLSFLSGISWPGSVMSSLWRYFSYLFPSAFGINGYVRVNSTGATLSKAAFEYRALWIQIRIYFLTTCFAHRRQIIQSRKNYSSLYPARL